MSQPTNYVAGFLFDQTRQQVVLIEKKRPPWQAGKLNGVGGKVEPGETGLDAMMREFEEETTIRVEGWEHVVAMSGPGWSVDFYRAFDTAAVEAIDGLAGGSPTDEQVAAFALRDPRAAPLGPCQLCEPLAGRHLEGGRDVITNLSWLIPLCLDRAVAGSIPIHDTGRAS